MARPSVLTPRHQDFPRWYQEVLAKAELAQQGITVRCLVGPDGAVPDSDDAPRVIAVVARAY
jgi:hypothetical protein